MYMLILSGSVCGARGNHVFNFTKNSGYKILSELKYLRGASEIDSTNIISTRRVHLDQRICNQDMFSHSQTYRAQSPLDHFYTW